MKQQTGATQLCLNVESAIFLPRCHKVQDVRMRRNTLMVSGFSHTLVSVIVPSEAVGGALHGVQTAVFDTLHLKHRFFLFDHCLFMGPARKQYAE